MSNLIRAFKGPVAAQFLSQSGLYYDVARDEIFAVERLGEAPCSTGQIIPCLRITYGDDVKQGAMLTDTRYVRLGDL